MALPDFLIIGAMKCGTSTLQAQLAAQPGIFMTTPKEPNFFSDDAIFSRGLAWYEGLFAAALPGDLKGEASTHYAKLPTHPDALARLAAVLPAPKLIYLIRNPLERAVSHYIHEWSMGKMSGNIETAFIDHPELVAYGCYGCQIEHYVRTFGAKAILLTSLETMTAEPQHVLNRIGAFLGHPGALAWQTENGRENISAQRVRRFPLQGLLIDNPVATALRRTLVPKALRDRVRQARQMSDRPSLTPALQSRLEAIFADDHVRLRAVLPDCADIAASYPFVPT